MFTILAWLVATQVITFTLAGACCDPLLHVVITAF